MALKQNKMNIIFDMFSLRSTFGCDVKCQKLNKTRERTGHKIVMQKKKEKKNNRRQISHHTIAQKNRPDK